MTMHRTQGFTLIEVMVAIAIFAVLSAMGWKVFDHISKVKTSNEIHEKNIQQLQTAYQIMLKDMLQLAPLNASIQAEIQPALVLQDQYLHFSKVGVSDPLKQSKPFTERIEYLYKPEEQKLYRLKYTFLHHNGNQQPLSSILLDRVENYQVTVLNPNEENTWPQQSEAEDQELASRLPKGVRVKLTVDQVEYEWLFSLLDTSYLEEQQPNQSGQNEGIGTNEE